MNQHVKPQIEQSLAHHYAATRARIFGVGEKYIRDLNDRARREERERIEREEREAISRRRRKEHGWREDLRLWAEAEKAKKKKQEVEEARRSENKAAMMDDWRDSLREWGLEQQRREREKKKREELADVDGFWPVPSDFPKKTIGEIVSEVLAKHNNAFTIYDIVCNRRGRDLAKVRHECIWEVYKQRPDLSTKQLGMKFFRDHTTIIYIVQKYKSNLAAE